MRDFRLARVAGARVGKSRLGVWAAETRGAVVRIERCARERSVRVRPISRCCSRPRRATGSPQGHLAFFIADTVAALALEAFYAPYEGDGQRNQRFGPQMMW
jgi:hypothetical protein